MTSVTRRARQLAIAWGCMALLAGCVSTKTVTTSVTGQSPPTSVPGASRDLVTSSDESAGTKRARVRLELAAAYFSRNQFTTALDEVKLALASDPNIPGGFNLRGLIYASLGDDVLAEESFRRALQINAQDADAMQNYGWYLCQRRRYDEANDLFTRALGVPRYADTPRTLLTQGICHARAGRLEVAEQTLMRAESLDPSNPVIAVNLSEVLYRRNELERARFYVRRVNGNPDLANSQTLWLATRIEHKLGNKQGERDFGQQLRNRFPQSPEAVAYDGGRFDE